MSAHSLAMRRAGAVALIALALDQASKIIVRREIEPGERVDFVAGIDFVRVANDGIAFGLLGGAGAAVIALAAAGFLVLLAYFAATTDREGIWLPLGLLAGGALGNLIDRISAGAVTDFIDLPRWPAFNVADIEITIGVLLIAILYLRDSEDDPEPEPAAEERGGELARSGPGAEEPHDPGSTAGERDRG